MRQILLAYANASIFYGQFNIKRCIRNRDINISVCICICLHRGTLRRGDTTIFETECGGECSGYPGFYCGFKYF